MDVDNREWGRTNPLDYVPFIGTAYRTYWWAIARRGARRYGRRGGTDDDEGDGEGWRKASHRELSRLLLSLVFTLGFGLLVVLSVVRDFETGLRPAVLFVIAGVFVYKSVSIVMNVFW